MGNILKEQQFFYEQMKLAHRYLIIATFKIDVILIKLYTIPYITIDLTNIFRREITESNRELKNHDICLNEKTKAQN